MGFEFGVVFFVFVLGVVHDRLRMGVVSGSLW
jgi:hypothetical protein